MKKTVIAILVFVVLAASGYGGWWYAAEKGMIAGKPNSPRAENFEAALNQYFSKRSGEGYYGRSCVSMNPDSASARTNTYKDTRIDYTPVGFRYSTGSAPDSRGNRKAQLEYMEKQGFFTSTANRDGGADYEMTWKGYAASNTNGCFFIQSAERVAKIIGFEKKRTDNGVDIYEVTASSPPKFAEPWTQAPEFREIFPQHAEILRQLNPNPLAYELARTATGFLVIAVGGKEYRPSVNENAALMLKMAGTLTAERVKKALEDYLVKTPNVANNNRVCLRLPGAAEVDAIGPVSQGSYTETPAAMTFDIYNLPGRMAGDNSTRLRSYVLLRRFETLGMANSTPLNYSEFNGMAALGGMRFEVKKEVADRFSPARGGCYVPVTLQVEEIIRFDQFNETGRAAAFTARMSLKPVDDEAKRIIAEFGHLSRAVAVGIPMIGGLIFKEGELQVSHAQARFPEFQPDISDVTIPAITTGLTRPPASAMRPAAAPGSYTLSEPYRGLGAAAGNAATPGAIEVHSVRVYEGTLPNGVKSGFRQHPEGTVTVQVWPSRSPVGIFLASYEPVNWVIQVRPGARVARVVTSGYHPQRVTFIGSPGAPVSIMPYTGDSGQSPVQATRAFGITPKSAQYVYTGKNFEVGK